MVATPLLGLFLNNKFPDRIVEIIAIGLAIYYISRAAVQIPSGYLVDHIRRDNDEIIIGTVGTLIMALPFFLFAMISEPWHYYVLQALLGIGSSMNLNAWRKLFNRNLDKNNEGIEYGIYETILSSASALIAIIGGTISQVGAQYFEGFIYTVGILIVIGGVVIAMVYLDGERKRI
jgi:MFS family permease